MHDNREKGILRKALEGILPDDILYRKKSPYPKTHHPEYTKGVSEWLKTIRSQKDSVLHTLLDRKQLDQLLETEAPPSRAPWFGQLMKGLS